MSGKLVAAALVGLLATALSAEAQTTNVTLYGRLNLTLEAVNGDAADPNASMALPVNRILYRLSSNFSRLGIRGSEALGGGLAAIFQIESNVQADISGGVLASRETFVGLQSPWGTLKLGYFTAPYFDIHSIFGNVPTLTTSILSTAALWSQGSQTKENGGFNARLGNSIRYDSPSLGGLTGSVQLGAYDFSPATGSGGTTYGTDADAKRHAYVLSTGAFYANGPFQGGIAYESNQRVRGAGLDDNALSIAANWNFGAVKVGGVYEHLDYDTPSGHLTRNFWGIGATIPIGPGELYAFWGSAADGKGSAANGTRVGQLVKGGGSGATQWELSYTYALSKRTLSYAGFVQTRNDNNANYNFAVNPYPIVNGADASGFVVGICHFF